MKIKSAFSLLVVAVISLLFTASCKKSFLEIPSTSSVDATKAITDLAGMQTVLNGIYNETQSADYYDRTFSLIPDLMADNSYISTNNHGRYLNYDRYILTKLDGNASSTWGVIYRMIVNANILINTGGSLENVDESDKDAVIGQAYALRALGHFDLVRLFAQPYNFTADASHPGIPIITNSSINLPKEVYLPARNTVKEVYDTIINDLKTAINLLPVTLPGVSSSYRGKITQNAAKALLSRVYLYTENWQGAKDMADDVIGSGKYKLLSGSNLVSGFSTADNTETIFEVVNTDQDNQGTNSLGAMYGQAKSYGDVLATQDLFDIYSPDDVRRNFMVIGDRLGAGAETNVPLILKYGNIPTDAENIKVIRLAEVYLNRAEAEAHLGGAETQNAIADLTVIAQRGDPSVVIDQSLTGQDLIDRILLERRKELAFEGQRLFDLTRNKMNFIKYETDNVSNEIDYPSDKTILPIPQDERNVNTNLTQNPGY